MGLTPGYDIEAFRKFVSAVTGFRDDFNVLHDESAVASAEEGLPLLAADCMDRECDLERILDLAHTKLREGGYLALFAPAAGRHNVQKARQTIENVLCKSGFGEIRISAANREGVFIIGRRVEKRDKKVVSFIIPVYNEVNTARMLLDSVYNKAFPDLNLEKELIIIESNSKDGTREIVQQFAQEHPEVRVIYEEKPEGKGHAVRQGFAAATGEFITIQDGDLEYDINDYDKLLKPLIAYEEAFVLGSRYTGDWHMRKFGGKERIKEFYLNLGQIMLTGLINLGCRTKLKDPFTMFKLFRRECLYGLTFDGNRFEIDWEIVVKLIRKGYIPREIPVNYQSRGFKEGKKIHVLRDPITCVLCFFKYRFLYRM